VTRRIPPRRGPERERGAALIVGLVLLLALTVLAVSTMRTASLELLMAGNTQFREDAFQMAETAVTTTMGDIVNGTVILAPQPGWEAARPGVQVSPTERHEAGVVYLSRSRVPAGSSLDLFICHNYRIDGRGFSARGARVDVSQGICSLGPRGTGP